MVLKQQTVILFQGVCNLCNDSMVFILKHERSPVFNFASSQSEAGQELLQWCELPKDYNQAVLLLDQGRAYFGSTAALRISQALKFPWSFLSSAGFIVPSFIRDWVYKQIALNRYRWFGKREVCMIPTRELKSRSL